jgi:hypothetical protein
VIVPDVHAFAGHIACDSRSASEIVLPVFDGAGALIAVFDVDSTELDAFDPDGRGRSGADPRPDLRLRTSMTDQIHPTLAGALEARGYAELTPVQTAVLGPEAAGRDLLVSAKTAPARRWRTGWPSPPTCWAKSSGCRGPTRRWRW